MNRRLALIEGQRAALTYAHADPALLRRLRALEVENANLRRRLAEAERGPASLAELNDARRAESDRLSRALEVVLSAHQSPEPLTAKRALRWLARDGFAPLPSERTVLRHLTALHKCGQTTCVHRDH